MVAASLMRRTVRPAAFADIASTSALWAGASRPRRPSPRSDALVEPLRRSWRP